MPALIEGQPVYVQGSGSKPWELKNVGGVYSCSCPSWRNQGGKKIDQRTCKHLRAHCGSASEDARVAAAMGVPAPAPAFSQAGVTTGRLQTAVPNVAAAPRTGAGPMTYEGRRVTADPVYAQSVIDRVVAEGRQLRQDEKAALFGPPVLLAHKFEDHEDLDPTGWWMSEKLDGVRAYWDGQEFVSRQGNIYNAPAWFKAALPKVPLDGELWMGRQMFQDTISVVKRDDWGPRAKDVMFVVFDAPASNLPFEDRVAYLEKLLAADQVHETHVKIHPHTLVASLEHVTAELKRLVALGAEGVMIRKPKSLYEAKRSHTLLKVKPFQDAEAELIGYEPGKKQHNGKVGGFILKMPSGKTFNLNAGTEERRVRPPKIGSLITYRFTELTKDGIPKCTSFVAVRDYE